MKRKGTEGNAPKSKYLNVQKEYYELKKTSTEVSIKLTT